MNILKQISDGAQQVGSAIAAGAKQAGDAIATGTQQAISSVSQGAQQVGTSIATGAQQVAANVAKTVTVENILAQALKVPGVRIPRDEFLKTALKGHCPDNVVELALAASPARAGIDRKIINRLANDAINIETTKVTGISAASGIPGGAAMIPATAVDIVQYFGFILRILQKLAYLYSFPDFDMGMEQISDSMMNELTWFVAVAFGVDGAAKGIASIVQHASAYYTKRVAQRALTKTALYPLTKKIAAQLGYKMTKQVFARGVTKAVPVAGALASGGITYFSFKICASRLKDALSTLPTADPSFYNPAPSPAAPIEVLPSVNPNAANIARVPDADIIDVAYTVNTPTPSDTTSTAGSANAPTSTDIPNTSSTNAPASTGIPTTGSTNTPDNTTIPPEIQPTPD